MEEADNKQQREEIYSLVVRAGKRTYFFDVKETRAKEKYLTITESKRRFSNDAGKFFYEKHKIFLYKEDFEKFTDGLAGVIDFIQQSNDQENTDELSEKYSSEDKTTETNETTEIKFEDLGTGDYHDDSKDDLLNISDAEDKV